MNNNTEALRAFLASFSLGFASLPRVRNELSSRFKPSYAPEPYKALQAKAGDTGLALTLMLAAAVGFSAGQGQSSSAGGTAIAPPAPGASEGRNLGPSTDPA